MDEACRRIQRRLQAAAEAILKEAADHVEEAPDGRPRRPAAAAETRMLTDDDLPDDNFAEV